VPRAARAPQIWEDVPRHTIDRQTPRNAAATIIIKSEIGRRNANDTKFIVPPVPVAAPGRHQWK